MREKGELLTECRIVHDTPTIRSRHAFRDSNAVILNAVKDLRLPFGV
jgi:hypothetical protein